MKLGITMLIHSKDDIKFVTEFPCFLGHPVSNLYDLNNKALYSYLLAWMSAIAGQTDGLNIVKGTLAYSD